MHFYTIFVRAFFFFLFKLTTKLLVVNRYFRHASGEMYVISQALAKFVLINRWVFSPLTNWVQLHITIDARVNFLLTYILQKYSPLVRSWWCECWILVYWAWCETCWWSQVLLLILVIRSLTLTLSFISNTDIPACFPQCDLLPGETEFSFSFPGAICAGVWFDFLSEFGFFGENKNWCRQFVLKIFVDRSWILFALCFVRKSQFSLKVDSKLLTTLWTEHR